MVNENDPLLDDSWANKRQIISSKPWYKRPSIGFILTVGFFYTLTSIGEPTRQSLRFQLACNSLINDKGYCDSIDAQLMVSNYNQVSAIVSQLSLLGALANIGKLLDKFGRKKFITLIVTVVLISRTILLSSYLIDEKFNFYLYIFCDFLASSTGGLFAMTGLINSYITDIIEPSQQNYLIGWGNGSIFAGESLGPLLSNFIIGLFETYNDQSDDMKPLNKQQITLSVIEIIIFGVLLVYSLILPESKLHCSGDFSVAKLNFRNLLQPLRILIPDQPSKVKKLIIFMVFLNCLSAMLSILLGEINLQYAIYMFKWTSKEIGYLMSLFSISRVMVLFLITPFLTNYLLPKYFTKKEASMDKVDFVMILFGIFCDLVLFSGLSISRNTFEYLAFTIFGSLDSIVVPTAQSIMLKYYDSNRNGEVLMAISLINGVGCIFAPIISMEIYKFGLTHSIPQLIFLSCLTVDIVVIIAFLHFRNI